MLIQLRSSQYITVSGRQQLCQSGEWVNVGNQTARGWLASGEAVRPDMPDQKALPGCGMVVPPYALESATKFMPCLDQVAQTDNRSIPFSKTLWYDPAVQLRSDLIAVGYGLLDTWEVVVPLYSYTILARDLGSDLERQRTESLIRDLRVPVYETRCLFLKRCRGTRDLMAAWLDEQSDSDNEYLSFLRALYRVKPLVLALPSTWTGGSK